MCAQIAFAIRKESAIPADRLLTSCPLRSKCSLQQTWAGPRCVASTKNKIALANTPLRLEWHYGTSNIVDFKAELIFIDSVFALMKRIIFFQNNVPTLTKLLSPPPIKQDQGSIAPSTVHPITFDNVQYLCNKSSVCSAQ